MTNFALAFPELPSAAAVDCVTPRWYDHVRIAWWMVKSLRFLPVVRYVVLAEFAACAGLAAWAAIPLFGWGALSLAVVAASALTVTVALICGFGAVIVGKSMKAHRRLYMGPGRKAVLLLIEHPGVGDGDGAGEWQIMTHLVAKTGEGYGAELRDRMVPPAQALAGPAGVVIYGTAANEKVMSIYVKQLAAYGFRDVGNNRIEWRSGWVPEISIA